MRILFADGLSDSAVERLRAGGDECVMKPSLTADDLPAHVAGFDALVVRSTRVTGPAMEAGTNLGLVVRAGAGTNTIDCQRAAELGVYVCNVPGRNAVAVAELAMGLVFATDRHIASSTADARAGAWNKKAYSRARGLYGSTLGIIGMGAIGLETAQRAAACGIRVVTDDKARSRSVRRRMAEIGVVTLPDLDAVLAAADVVSLHVPGGPGTTGMVDAGFLAKMKHDAVLINTSRGEVIDEAALLDALDSTDMSAGIDVFAEEPPSGTGSVDSALARHPKVTVTHHIGASTNQAQEAVAEGTVEVLEEYRTGSIINCVNLEQAPHRTATLSVRHYDRVGVLASVLQELRSCSLNVANMSNRIFAGSQAAVATIEVFGAVDEQLLDAVRALPDVIQVSAFDP
ncbi:MAG: hydroxyacid dehydrogenase [Acidimicrobiaceae bacterium]|nr:hydroxyacid dehydrogenase [Acidimicrobiaceae bacterium]MYE97917.1 hydroxyacid dehydrogenase [Acidimicrobiaceae bacterium]MYI52410.1 hydroxyacid dehydrogenase [Acidimicrobiaceae bacterium]MYJ81926.1 hydroxyacid dehydrogenase [Acidimicrobiaceae bacterium]